MKFKKEDVGLYVALGIVGAGVGLLVGALVASRRNRPVERRVFGGVDDIIETEDGIVITGHLNEEGIELVDTDKPPMMWKHTGRQAGKTQNVRQKEPDVEMSQEMLEFIENYGPTQMQIEMIQSGLLSIDEVADSIVLKEDYEPTSYSSQYAPSEVNQPTLDELLGPEKTAALLGDDLIDDRYLVMNPEDAGEVDIFRTFYYNGDEEFDQWIFISGRGHVVPLRNIQEYIDRNSWPDIKYLLETHEDVLVQDTSSQVIYRFLLHDALESGEDIEEDDE